MKISKQSSTNNEPLLGAKVIFTKHTEDNRNHGLVKSNKIKLSKVYEVVGYSSWHCPQVLCENGTLGDVPMSEMDYDIVSMPEKKFVPVVITLETEEDVEWFVQHSDMWLSQQVLDVVEG